MGDVLIVLMMMIQRVARGDLPAKITATNLSPHTTVYYMIAPIRACELAGLADAAFRSNTLQTCANLNTYCPPRQQEGWSIPIYQTSRRIKKHHSSLIPVTQSTEHPQPVLSRHTHT